MQSYLKTLTFWKQVFALMHSRISQRPWYAANASRSCIHEFPYYFKFNSPNSDVYDKINEKSYYKYSCSASSDTGIALWSYSKSLLYRDFTLQKQNRNVIDAIKKNTIPIIPHITIHVLISSRVTLQDSSKFSVKVLFITQSLPETRDTLRIPSMQVPLTRFIWSSRQILQACLVRH